MLHSVLHSWGVLSDPVQLPQAFRGRILLCSALSSGSSCLSRGGDFHQHNAGASGESRTRCLLPGRNELHHLKSNLNCCWISEAIFNQILPSPALTCDFYLFPCQQYLVILMAFLAWANVAFNLLDFGSSFSYTRSNPIVLATQFCSTFAQWRERVISTGTCPLSHCCWPVIRDCHQVLAGLEQPELWKPCPGDLLAVPEMTSHGRGKSKGPELEGGPRSFPAPQWDSDCPYSEQCVTLRASPE